MVRPVHDESAIGQSSCVNWKALDRHPGTLEEATTVQVSTVFPSCGETRQLPELIVCIFPVLTRSELLVRPHFTIHDLVTLAYDHRWEGENNEDLVIVV